MLWKCWFHAQSVSLSCECTAHLPGSEQVPPHQQCWHCFVLTDLYHCPASSQPIRKHLSVLLVDRAHSDSIFCAETRIKIDRSEERRVGKEWRVRRSH